MSADNKLMDWCKIPPEPPRNRHRKLLASGLICTIVGSILASLTLFYSGFIIGSANTFATSSTILSIANLGEGPSYIQNATYQPVAEANNSTVQNYNVSMTLIQENVIGVLSIGGLSGHSNDTSASLNTTVINFGEQDLTATSIEIYRGDLLFAQIDGPFVIEAHSVGIVNFQVSNLTELSKDEAQLITQFYEHQGESNVTIFAGRVMYPIVLKTSEGISAGFEKFLFPTAYFS